MRRLWRRFGTILVLLALLGGALGYLARDRSPGGAERLVAPVSSAPRLLITRGGEGPFALLRREDGSWWIADGSQGVDVRAEDEAAEAVYQALVQARVGRRLRGAAAEARRYGLGSPRLRVRPSPGAELAFGDAADGEWVYLGRADEPDVLLVEGRLLSLLDHSAVAFGQRTPALPAQVAAAREVGLGAVRLVRRPSSWVLRGPPEVRAQGELVAAVLAALGQARGVPLPRAAAGAVPGMPLTLDGAVLAGVGGACPWVEEGPGAKPEAGARPEAKEGRVLGRADGTRLCFVQKDLAPLLLPAPALRELRLLPFPPAEVAELDLPGVALRQRPDGEYFINGAPADREAVRAYLADLASTSGEPVAAATVPTAGVAARFRTVAGDEVTLRLLAGPPVLVLRDGEPPLRAPGDVADQLRAVASRFWPRRLLSFVAHDARGLRRTVRGAPEEIAERLTPRGPLGEGWRLRQPVEAPTDSEQMTRLLGALADLRVLRWQDAADFTDEVQVQIRLADGRTLKVRRGPVDGAGCLVRATPGGDQAGLIPAETCALLGQPWLAPAPLLLDDARFAALRLTPAEGAARILTQGGGRFLLDGAPADPGEVERLRDALRALATPATVTYGDPKGARLRCRLAVTLAALAVPASPLSGVAPPQQELLLFAPRSPAAAGGGAQVLAQVPGRAVTYRLATEVSQKVRRGLGASCGPRGSW